MARHKKWIILLVIAALLIAAAVFAVLRFHLIPGKTYTAEHFGIQTAVSAVDYDGDGVDDYADILAGAKLEAEAHPKYRSAYYDGGYPPEGEGVCTDVVWRAMKNAGYCLRDMVDKDIRARPEAYTEIETPDKNIDFRRVRNLRVFLEKYAIRLTDDPEKIDQWQPGDIVIFKEDKHIGIISDLRSGKGITYVIHNAGQPNREENYLPGADITGHYRFDAALVPEDVPVRWTE